jgi:hypothetical protein
MVDIINHIVALYDHSRGYVAQGNVKNSRRCEGLWYAIDMWLRGRCRKGYQGGTSEDMLIAAHNLHVDWSA